MDQINKLRGGMGDFQSPAHKIQRPKGMKKYLFERRVDRIARLEKKVERLLLQELSRYKKRKERQDGIKKANEQRRAGNDRG